MKGHLPTEIINKRKKTVYNIELKSEIGNVTQNNYKTNRAE